MTYEAILAKMLDKVPSHLDKREGSVVFDSIAPAAFEISRVYATLEYFLMLGFLEGSVGEYLDYKAAESGIVRFAATNATIKVSVVNIGEEKLAVPINTKFFCEKNSLYYTVIDKSEDGDYILSCDSIGASGNINSGNFMPTTTVPNFYRAFYVTTISYGEDAEGDAALKKRCLEKMGDVTAQGNAAQYNKWAEGFSGIGRIRLELIDDILHIFILGGDNLPATEDIVESFQEYLDPNSEGLGMGVAPIGAKIVVHSPYTIEVNADVRLTIGTGADYNDVVAGIEEALLEMVKDVSFINDKFSYFDFTSRLLKVAGIASIQAVSINDATQDVPLIDNIVPRAGTVTVTLA